MSDNDDKNTGSSKKKLPSVTPSAPAKRTLVSGLNHSVQVMYKGELTVLNPKDRVKVDPSHLDEKNLPNGVTLI